MKNTSTTHLTSGSVTGINLENSNISFTVKFCSSGKIRNAVVPVNLAECNRLVMFQLGKEKGISLLRLISSQLSCGPCWTHLNISSSEWNGIHVLFSPNQL